MPGMQKMLQLGLSGRSVRLDQMKIIIVDAEFLSRDRKQTVYCRLVVMP